jgi:hypothetical protein
LWIENNKLFNENLFLLNYLNIRKGGICIYPEESKVTEFQEQLFLINYSYLIDQCFSFKLLSFARITST